MFGNTNKELEEAFNEKQTVSNPVEAVVSSELCKCGCRACHESRSNVHILDPVNNTDWGNWDYCEDAIQVDINEGFTVTRI